MSKQNKKKMAIAVFVMFGFAVGLILLVALVSVAWAQNPPGKDIFTAKCQMCHGADGTANTPMGKKLNIPSFKAPEVQKQTDAQLKTIIAKGKGNNMRAFEGQLTGEQIAQVVGYVRQLSKQK